VLRGAGGAAGGGVAGVTEADGDPVPLGAAQELEPQAAGCGGVLGGAR
jgi:hypothetical protein